MPEETTRMTTSGGDDREEQKEAWGRCFLGGHRRPMSA
jgi:hypothetical protein